MPDCPEESSSSTKALVFDASILENESNIPPEFIWPDDEKPCLDPPPPFLQMPHIDLNAYFSGDPTSVSKTIDLVKDACRKHGFFLVVNHGIDPNLLKLAHQTMDFFFRKPLSHKQKAQRKLGDHCGYASSFTNRFSSKLPWKETLSFQYSAHHHQSSSNIAQNYFINTMGEEFGEFGYTTVLKLLEYVIIYICLTVIN